MRAGDCWGGGGLPACPPPRPHRLPGRRCRLQVVSYLRSLGIKQEFLGPRVICAHPALLMRSVELEVRPVVSFLASLGLEAQQVVGCSEGAGVWSARQVRCSHAW